MPEEKVSLQQLTPAAPPQITVPTDLVPLPSEGRVYAPPHPLSGAKYLTIRSMTAHDEDVLTSRALLKSGKAISQLISSCVMEKGFDVDDMLVGDRNAAIIGIRITGYGAEYPISVSCPQCGEKSERDIDLGTLPIKRFPENLVPVAPFANEFEFVLPSSKIPVTFKLMTGRDEREFMDTVERTRKLGLPEELVTTRLRTQVVSFDGKRDRAEVAARVLVMSAKDSRELRRYIDEVAPGIELKTSFSCSSCDYLSEEVDVPLGTEFFWPRGR